MRVGSLFSGIGGIDLGLERAGMEVAWQCEIDPYCRRVLAKHWPNVPCYEDVRNLPDDIEPVDLICGGYPCQPFSLAGVRAGANDPRHLWPDFARLLGVLRPPFVLLENVPGHLSLGFGTVLGDLAELGYDAEWTCVPAAAVGAPHLRWRVFVFAHANSEGEPSVALNAFSRSGVVVPDASSDELWDESEPESWGCSTPVTGHDGEDGNVAHPDSSGLSHTQGRTAVAERPRWRTSDRPGWWDVEPDVGRVADGVPNRVDRLRALGNAVVPQVAELVGRRIMEVAA